MPNIPSNINGVSVKFSPNVNKSVSNKIIEALKLVIKTDIASGHKLATVYISSANDQHKLPSRHVQGAGKAVDISRINSMKMSIFYPSDATIKAVVEAMQLEFEKYPQRRENFGPFLKKKLGATHNVSGHNDHIHFSVN